MKNDKEGLSFIRFIMVVGSFSPLFILWAIKGIEIPFVFQTAFSITCMLIAILPNLLLYKRIKIAKIKEDVRELVIKRIEDHRNYILIYLFTVLLPFYALSVTTIRELISVILAILTIIYIFYYLEIYYINILFAMLGYYIYKIYIDERKDSEMYSYILISKNRDLKTNTRVSVYRITKYMFIERQL